MKVKSTTFADDDTEHSTPIIVEKEMSERDAIREFVQSHSMYTFGGLQGENIIDAIVNGFFLFNLRENKYMLNSKAELLQYCKDNTVSLEEKMYFWDIFLFNQRPKFLTSEEHDYIRDCGNLDGYVEKKPVFSGGGSSSGSSGSSDSSSSSIKTTSNYVCNPEVAATHQERLRSRVMTSAVSVGVDGGMLQNMLYLLLSS